MSIPIYSIGEKRNPSIKDLLITEIKRHPHSQLEDIYKFLHQAAFGSEHAVKDLSEARKWLEQKIAGLDFSKKDDLIDNLSPDGRIVRINLRTYLKKGFDLKILLDAFVKTANNYKGSVENFRSFWKSAEELCSTKDLSFSKREMEIFFEEQSKKNFPAIHHSKKYEAEYKPAYRVVDIRYLSFLKK